MAQFSATTPKLLILDEITNNIDLDTKNHIIQVLKSYPGAMIIISYDFKFLESTGIKEYYEIIDSELIYHYRE